MTEKRMVKRVRDAVAELQEQYYATPGDAFSHFAMRTYFELDDDDALVACDVGGPDDKGIDAFRHDEEQRQVIVAQAKYSSRAKSFDRAAVVELQAAWTSLKRLGGRDRPRAREQVVEAARELARLRASDPHYPVELFCFASGPFTRAAHDAADAFNSEHDEDHVTMHLVDLDDLIEVLSQQDSRLRDAPADDIELQLEKFFEFAPEAGEPPTIVASVNGLALAQIEREYQYRIFQRNVRYYLNARQRYNRGIANTLASTSGRGRFWYYNNGISIVCDHVDLEPLEDGRALARVRNLQIVNGCQTTTTLGDNVDRLEDPSSPAYVLVRIISAANEDLQSEISLYNNRQNQVKDRDLQSNDATQDRLQLEFGRLDPPWYYARKRGEYDAVVKPDPRARARFGPRQLDNEKVAQAAYAFYHDPGVARARKGYLFVRRLDDPERGLYEDIFNDATTPEWLLLPYRLSVEIDARRKAYMRQLKDALAGSESGLGVEVLRQQQWIKFGDQILLGAIHLYLSQRVDLEQGELESLLQDAVFEPITKRAYAAAVRDLTQFFLSKHSEARAREETFVEANYVKGNWTQARGFLLAQMSMRDAIDEDIFSGIEVLQRS